LANFQSKFESLSGEERVSFLSERESVSSNTVVDLQDWCLDNSEILMELGIAKCWLRCDEVLAIHCYHLNHGLEIRETLLEAICVTDELLGIKLKSMITSKAQVSIHLELCGVFEPTGSSEVLIGAQTENRPTLCCDLLPVKQQMITI